MCWAENEINAVRRKAKEDIPCVKVLYTKGGKTYSPFRCTLYHDVHQRKCMVESKIRKKYIGAAILINEGIHSYEDKFSAWIPNKKHCAYQAIIPKGSIYYVNRFGEIVSNKLIVYRKKAK